ncbi:hypothetical protein WMF38_08630 [Sorangium sp. So ce118]
MASQAPVAMSSRRTDASQVTIQATPFRSTAIEKGEVRPAEKRVLTPVADGAVHKPDTRDVVSLPG